MGYPTKVQLIKRRSSEQWYINFPSAVAQAMEFRRGEVVEWVIEDKARLTLTRPSVKASVEKKRPPGSTEPSRASGDGEAEPSGVSG
jgi:hypothetical protein